MASICGKNMRLSIIYESVGPNATIYNVAHLWLGSFIASGAVKPQDASELGFRSGALTNDDSHGKDAVVAAVEAFKTPHPILVGEILELPDGDWVKTLTLQSRELSPNLIFDNVRIIDRKFDGYNICSFYHILQMSILSYLENLWTGREKWKKWIIPSILR